jgi:hypothetical protein
MGNSSAMGADPIPYVGNDPDLVPYIAGACIGTTDSNAADNAERARLYRERHHRVDYKPGPVALACLKRHMSANPGVSISAAIDALVTGNDGGGDGMRPIGT